LRRSPFAHKIAAGEFILKISFPRFHGVITITLTMLTMMLAIAGCSAMQPDPAVVADQKESMLSAAGFTMLPADNADKLAKAQALPQLKVKYFSDPDSTVHYWMADAQFCHCVYVGNQSNYQKFKEMQFQAQLANEQSQSAEMQSMAAQEEEMEMMNPMLVGPVWLY
jgi:hypothetical protein